MNMLRSARAAQHFFGQWHSIFGNGGQKNAAAREGATAGRLGS
jgi:hypothetical protein